MYMIQLFPLPCPLKNKSSQMLYSLVSQLHFSIFLVFFKLFFLSLFSSLLKFTHFYPSLSLTPNLNLTTTFFSFSF